MSYEIVLTTHLPLPLFKKGKVRDIYDLGEKLLVVSTDRISAFDVVLPNGIPQKGEALNRLSAYWFNETKTIIPNHIVEVVDPRTVLVKKAKLIKVEFVVRGYLYGSAWENYRKGKSISGIRLPQGLRKAERLPQPLLTPTTKEETGHDLELTREDVVKRIGKDLAKTIDEICLKIYERASKKAEATGIIVADTKMEFGMLDEELVLIDELFTPDSSRFWPRDKYEVGEDQLSFDKQYVRDYLISIGWNKQPPAPELPEHVVQETSKKYIEAYERLTGKKL
ncbi:MAG: phosphoribosylaminoimidazolesuccinocarboxamide synthase [Candidatus Bathyarchaeia archaeon]